MCLEKHMIYLIKNSFKVHEIHVAPYNPPYNNIPHASFSAHAKIKMILILSVLMIYLFLKYICLQIYVLNNLPGFYTTVKTICLNMFSTQVSDLLKHGFYIISNWLKHNLTSSETPLYLFIFLYKFVYSLKTTYRKHL